MDYNDLQKDLMDKILATFPEEVKAYEEAKAEANKAIQELYESYADTIDTKRVVVTVNGSTVLGFSMKKDADVFEALLDVTSHSIKMKNEELKASNWILDDVEGSSFIDES